MPGSVGEGINDSLAHRTSGLPTLARILGLGIIGAIAKRIIAGLGRVLPSAGDPAVKAQLLPLVRALIVGVGGLALVIGWSLFQRYPSAQYRLGGGALVAVVGLFLLGGTPRPSGGVSGGGANLGAKIPAAPVTGVPTKVPTIRRRFLAPIYIIVYGFIALVGIVGTWLAIPRDDRPAEADIRAAITAGLAPLPVRLTDFKATLAAPKIGVITITYQGRIETTEPLYRRLQTADWLTANPATRNAGIDAAKTLLQGPDGDRLRGVIGTPEPTPDLRDLVLLQTAVPAGTSFPVSGSMAATPNHGTWILTPGSTVLDRSTLRGERRPAGAAVFVVDLPADADRLDALLAAHANYAESVVAAARNPAPAAPIRSHDTPAMPTGFRTPDRFSGTRVPVTIEHPKDDVTVLRTSAAPPPPGWCALCCGKQAFEVLLQ